MLSQTGKSTLSVFWYWVCMHDNLDACEVLKDRYGSW